MTASLNGQPIERLTLIDVTAPQKPAKFAGKVETAAVDIADAAAVPPPLLKTGRT